MEIHVQLATRTKMFCGCPVEFGAPPNSRVCAVCGGLPGALPVINRKAVEHAMRVGMALNCRLARFTKWDRKSYFYPDLPKNYQISQYDLPLASGGRFEMPGMVSHGQAKTLDRANRPGVNSQPSALSPQSPPTAIRIRRAHLEEDAGKNLHEGLDHTRVDLNRAGTPLLEIVTEPDLSSADDAYAFCIELQRLVRHLGVSDADMQKGQMRFEPNVNLAITHEGREYRTPISEIKNLNSFRAVRDAIAYEIDRQASAWKADHDYTLERLGKMNFGWDDVRGVTEFQRGKEEAHDYRYFPDPDLVPVVLEDEWVEAVRAGLGELPLARQARYERTLGLSRGDAETILADRATADLFDAALATGADAQTLCKQFLSFWSAEANRRGTTIAGLGIVAARLAELARLVADGSINATTAALVATKMLEWGQTPREIVEAGGMLQIRDLSAVERWVDEALAANPKAVADATTNPKKMQAAIGFLRGQVMKLSGGKADPKAVGEMIERKLRAVSS